MAHRDTAAAAELAEASDELARCEAALKASHERYDYPHLLQRQHRAMMRVVREETIIAEDA